MFFFKDCSCDEYFKYIHDENMIVSRKKPNKQKQNKIKYITTKLNK